MDHVIGQGLILEFSHRALKSNGIGYIHYDLVFIGGTLPKDIGTM